MATPTRLARVELERSLVPLIMRTSRTTAILWFAASPALALEDAQCLRCHDDPEMTSYRGDTEMSAYVTAAMIAGSVHAGMACVECHTDLADSKRRRHAEDLENRAGRMATACTVPQRAAAIRWPRPVPIATANTIFCRRRTPTHQPR
jgi:hypothetical protein